ncbi:MAG: ethylbenzene dehydrogenase-related protein [Polyangiales bacterium]
MSQEEETPGAAASSPLSRRVALAALAAVGAACRRGPKPAQRLDHVRVARVDGPLPKRDPLAEAWDEATEYEAALAPQNVTPPMLQRPAVARVKVRALHDLNWVAFRLEWEDRSRDELLGPAIFSDACAVQLPRDPGSTPGPMMGHPGAPVRLIYWKGAWQTPDMLAALHPNKPPTDYPYEAARPEHRRALELQYAPARATGNPNLVRRGDRPVMVGEAEMFGSFTAVRDREADGFGVHQDGRWRVVLGAPVGVVNGALNVGESQVAFAVWEGAAQNVGGRKMRSEAWVRLVVA